MMTKRARVLGRVHAIDRAGRVWATEPSGIIRPVYDVSQINGDYRSVLAAAPLMLRAIDLALPMLDTIGRVFEARGMDDHVVPVMQLEAGLHVAIKTALDDI